MGNAKSQDFSKDYENHPEISQEINDENNILAECKWIKRNQLKSLESQKQAIKVQSFNRNFRHGNDVDFNSNKFISCV